MSFHGSPHLLFPQRTLTPGCLVRTARMVCDTFSTIWDLSCKGFCMNLLEAFAQVHSDSSYRLQCLPCLQRLQTLQPYAICVCFHGATLFNLLYLMLRRLTFPLPSHVSDHIFIDFMLRRLPLTTSCFAVWFSPYHVKLVDFVFIVLRCLILSASCST